MQDEKSIDFHKQAEQLYRWLIEPITKFLPSIKTLIIVPDDILRTIPFAALYDGEQFLVQRYALAITPGWELTTSTPIPLDNVQVLLSGLSKGRNITVNN